MSPRETADTGAGHCLPGLRGEGLLLWGLGQLEQSGSESRDHCRHPAGTPAAASLSSPAPGKRAVTLKPSPALATPHGDTPLGEPASSATPQGSPGHPLDTFPSYSALAIPTWGRLGARRTPAVPALRPDRSQGQARPGLWGHLLHPFRARLASKSPSHSHQAENQGNQLAPGLMGSPPPPSTWARRSA